MIEHPLATVTFDPSLMQLVVLFGIIFFAGFVDSIAGGGGLLTIPAYIAMGVPEAFILGTNKCVSSAGTTIAVGRYLVSGLMDWRLIPLPFVCAGLSAFAGAHLSRHLDSSKMTYLLLVLVPLAFWASRKAAQKSALSMVKEASEIGLEASTIDNTLLTKVCLISLVIGGYDGFFGPGTGTFLLIALVYVLNFDLAKGSAHARIYNYASNLGAFAFFSATGRILWGLAAIAMVASILGNLLGSSLVVKKQGAIVKPVFLGVLGLLLLRCLFMILID